MQLSAISLIFFAGAALAFPVLERNPEEAGKFEGDIDGIENFSQLRAALQNRNVRWPQGVVYYRISRAYSAAEVNLIKKGMQEYHKYTCIKFVEATNQRDYVSIEKLAGCYSSVGRTGGVQTLSLGHGCVHIGVIVHEFMHAIGFYHEHSRPDRDYYVRINWQYIEQGKAHAFNKYTNQFVDTQQFSYDYGSIMHYDRKGFSIDPNRFDTITPLQPGVTIGQRQGFSSMDVAKIKKYYQCG